MVVHVVKLPCFEVHTGHLFFMWKRSDSTRAFQVVWILMDWADFTTEDAFYPAKGLPENVMCPAAAAHDLPV